MGGGVSKKPNSNRVCPEDICLDDFEKIKKIFKKIEKNKKFSIQNLELEQISEIHIKNKIKVLKKEIEKLEFENKKFILEKNLQFLINKNKLLDLKEKSIQNRILETEKAKNSKLNEIKKLQRMSKNEKKAMFKRRVSIEGAYDFELFSAAQNKWLEISSVSTFENFQSERLKIKYKSEDGVKKNVHTLNGSALALPRVMASLLENCQTKNGIEIPKCLIPYTGFKIIN